MNAGGTPGNRGGTGRPPSTVKALAAAKLPRHIQTLDDIAGGVAYITIRERCPRCGHTGSEGDVTQPVSVRPGEQTRAVDTLLKIADPKELVITGERARAFFDCVWHATVEAHGEPAAHVMLARALDLMERTV